MRTDDERHYTKPLTLAEARNRFEAAMARIPNQGTASYYRGGVDIESTPGEGALWLRQFVDSGIHGAEIGALQDASMALLGYHNALVLADAQRTGG